MDDKLKQDLQWFFQVFQNRNARILALLPAPMQSELAEELKLLEMSVINRVNEAFQT